MSSAASAAAMDYSDTGNVDFIPDQSTPDKLVFSVGFNGPDQYQKRILVALYNSATHPGVLERINTGAENEIFKFTHGVHYCIICFLVTAANPPVTIPILYRTMVTGQNPNVIHEYYGLTRHKLHDRNLYRDLARAAGRSVGEILNTCFFSRIYDYVRFDATTQRLVPEMDPDNTTLTWLGIDYFGNNTGRSFIETRRLQEVVDGAFIFPRCVYTMHATQSSQDVLGKRFSHLANSAGVSMFNIIGVDKTTPLKCTPGISFISGYSSRELRNFGTDLVPDVPKKLIQIFNCNYVNGLNGDNAEGSHLTFDFELGGVMVRRSTTTPDRLQLDERSTSDPATTEYHEGTARGFFKLKDKPTPICEAPLVRPEVGKTDSRDLDYLIHTHPLACYRINRMGFGPPSGPDLNCMASAPDVDGGIVFSFDGEWMYYINPVLRYYMKTDPILASGVMRCNIPDDWTTRSRSTAVDLYKGGALTPSNTSPELREAITAYIASLAEITLQYRGLTIPMFHCQYHPRIPKAGEPVWFVVP
jgi:hypothetical protein